MSAADDQNAIVDGIPGEHPAPKTSTKAPAKPAQKAATKKPTPAPVGDSEDEGETKAAGTLDEGEPKPEPNAIKPATAAKKADDRVEIMIHEGPDVPPSGVSVSVNGTMYMIQPNAWVKVPAFVVEVLTNAVETKPVVQNGQIIGHRSSPRYPFQVRGKQ